MDKFLTSLLPQHLPSLQVHSDPRALFPSHTLFSSSHFTHTHSPQQSLTNSHTVSPTTHSHRNPNFYLLTSYILILTLDQSASVSGPVCLCLSPSYNHTLTKSVSADHTLSQEPSYLVLAHSGTHSPRTEWSISVSVCLSLALSLCLSLPLSLSLTHTHCPHPPAAHPRTHLAAAQWNSQ